MAMEASYAVMHYTQPRQALRQKARVPHSERTAVTQTIIAVGGLPYFEVSKAVDILKRVWGLS